MDVVLGIANEVSCDAIFVDMDMLCSPDAYKLALTVDTLSMYEIVLSILTLILCIALKNKINTDYSRYQKKSYNIYI